ncbi:MAG: PEP-CTERM sorting domain-containing protein [Betaproteobacteria bacterium]|nr:PEP-CTERM sorting domain-containing protein [Betaproteobacteria bacterium]
MDNALATPSGGIYYFSGLWNSTLSAFAGALGGNNPLFFFNNNQINSGASTNQDLAVWAQLSLTGTNVQTKYFDFTNNGGAYAPFNLGGGGVLNGDVTAYTSSGAGPLAGTNAKTDYVLSGGQVCLDAAKAPTPCDGSGNPVVTTVNNNLGANNAAYAIDVPELNQWLSEWLLGQHAGYTDLHIDLRYGCDPLTDNTLSNNCIGRDGNNGYEQLFVGTSLATTQVPEPGSVALLGLGLLGLAAGRLGGKASRNL